MGLMVLLQIFTKTGRGAFLMPFREGVTIPLILSFQAMIDIDQGYQVTEKFKALNKAMSSRKPIRGD